MKKTIITFVAALMFTSAFAQETESKFSISSDIVSRYVWRGTQFSTSAAVQPGISYATGGLTLGAWGSYALDASGSEADLFASYDFDFGLGVVLTDYYFPQDPITAWPGGYVSEDTHVYELGLSYSVGGLSLAGYKYLNFDKALYFEASYAFKDASVFVGAGNESYSMSGDFNVVNLGLTVSKEVAISDKYSVAPYASFIVNPNQEQVFLVVGVTL